MYKKAGHCIFYFNPITTGDYHDSSHAFVPNSLTTTSIKEIFRFRINRKS